MKYSRNLRLVAVGAFLVAGLAVYRLWFRQEGPIRRSADPVHQAWQGKAEETWREWRYLSLSDGDAVRSALAARVKESLLLRRLNLTREQEEKLAAALSVALTALPAAGPDEYLAAVFPIRRLRASPQNANLMLWYKLVTGRPMPMNATSRQVLEELWSHQKPRPREASLADPNGAWWGISEWDTSSKRQTFTTLNNVDPAYNESAELWANPIGSGAASVTEPFQQSAGHPSSPLKCVLFDTIVRVGDEYRMYSISNCFWSPTLGDWVVEYNSVATDEGFCWVF